MSDTCGQTFNDRSLGPIDFETPYTMVPSAAGSSRYHGTSPLVTTTESTEFYVSQQGLIHPVIRYSASPAAAPLPDARH